MNIFIRLLAGCILLGAYTGIKAAKEPPQVHFVVKSFVVSGDNPLSESKTQSVLSKFTGDHYGLEGLQTAVEKFEAALRDAGYAFFRVNLIPQELKDGVIEFKVTEFKVDNIVIEGNDYFSTDNILNSAPTLEKGQTPNTSILSRAINMANSQPSKSIKLQFSESETGGAIDAKLIVEDNDPDFFFVGLNNTGTDETGNFRLTGGYLFTNLFDTDQNLSLSYTMSPDDTDAVNQYGFVYSVPFYESGSKLSLVVSHSDVDSGVVEQQFDVSGIGTVVSLRYNKLFLQQGAYKQELEFGLDRKRFEDSVVNLAGAQVNTGADVVSRPISITYRGSRLSTTSNLDFSIGFYSNISGGSGNEDVDYGNSRGGYNPDNILNPIPASADWSLFKYSVGYLHFLTQDWLFRFALQGQGTKDLLISGEQFGIGGMNSIRGYDERDVLGDTGYQVNLELWLPNFSSYKIRPLVFYDFGRTETLDPFPAFFGALEAKQNPASYGAGLRYSWKESLNATLDVGYVTKDAGTAVKGDTRAHLNVFYRF